MAPRNQLNQVLTFTGVAPGAIVSLPHQLNVGPNSAPVVPDLIFRDNADFSIIGCTMTTLTVQNNGTSAETLHAWLWHQHTFDREYGPSSVTDLSPQPFVPAVGGSGGGSGPVPQTIVATGFIDFVGDTGATGVYFGNSGTGLAEMINAQTLVGPTGAPWPFIGACRLHVQSAGDDAFIDLSAPSGRAITDGQVGTLGEITFEIAAKVNDDETTVGNSTDVEFFGTTLGFEASNFVFGNNHWWAMGDPAHPGGFDTGVPVDTLRVHKYRTEENPATPVLKWLIDGVVVHQAATALPGSAFSPFLDCNVDAANGANDVIIDYISWSIAVTR